MTTKAKAKTVRVRVAVFYSGKGRYMAGADGMGGKRLHEDDLIAHLASLCEDADANMDNLPHTSIVEIELPIPELVKLKGKVRNVKP